MSFIVDTSHSPRARLRPVGVAAVRLTDAFWQPCRERNRVVTLPGQHAHLETTGRLNNFRRATHAEPTYPFEGIFFNDSDVYKWAEAAAWALADGPDPALEASLDDVIGLIAAAQQPDGYLNTYYLFDKAGQRFTDLKQMHELYCAGHLIQAAVAHFRVTQKRDFLAIAVRLADHLDTVFGDAPGKRPGACGHEECELALVELFRATGEARYLALARHMIAVRGREPAVITGTAHFGRNYYQDHLPFAEQRDATGHAVRQLYLASGATDVLLEQEEPAWESALHALFESFTRRRMYVTGGAGSRYEGEAFGGDYELTSERAYTETCAAIGSVMWNARMLLLTGDAAHGDLLEWTLYNAVLPGLSQDSTHYFYQNPLADRGAHRRQAWFGCACCPPNVARLLAQLPGYFYARDDDGTIVVNLFARGTATIGATTVTQETRYPWDGRVTLTATGDAPALRIRIPGWVRTDDAAWKTVPLVEGRATVTIDLPMVPRRLVGSPRALAVRGQVALARGPLLYCVEDVDHPGTDVWDVAIADEAPIRASWNPDLLGGVVTLHTTGRVATADIAPVDIAPLSLYGPPGPASVERTLDVTLVPYFAWANREAGAMTLWLIRG